MNIAKLFSRALSGMSAPQVIVEVHVASGLPSFSIVGLLDTEVRESRDRVRSAIQNSGFAFPARRITVNLAPADLPKESGRYDLPIALGILLASGLVKAQLDTDLFEFAGELALDGELRPVKGALALTWGAGEQLRQFILPEVSAREAALISQVQVLAAPSLSSVIEHLTATANLPIARLSPQSKLMTNGDLNQVKGQVAAKKALEIAAAGRHSLLMLGNPGCGKSMLAARLTSIMPLLEPREALLSASIHSVASNFNLEQWQQVPFRTPHHSSSIAAMVGGGANPKPGEVSLAHHGVLFLDELAEFDRRVLEALREPLEAKKVRIARARHKVEFAADFQLIAAMNPCPCGNLGHPQKNCSCSVEQINRYRAKISGPLLDRIDMVVEMPSLKTAELHNLNTGEDSASILSRVIMAREIQLQRQHKLNYALANDEVARYCVLNPDADLLLQDIIDKQALSARGYYRMLKLARTIADLAATTTISSQHLALASRYKPNI